MFRFDQLFRSNMIVRDVKVSYPQTASVFEEFGFRDICDDCSIEVVARKQNTPVGDVLERLNRVVFGNAAGGQD